MASQAVMLERGPAATVELSTAHEAALGRSRLELGGVMIDKVDVPSAVKQIERFLHAGGAHQIVTVNLDFLTIARHNQMFRETLNRADLAVADGMPLVWMSKLHGDPLPERVTGVRLVDECCQLAVQAAQGIFLLGAAPGIAEKAGQVLMKRWPGLRVVGTYSPPLGPMSGRENARIVRQIRAARPGFLFVALGAPRQDLWVRHNLDRLNVPVTMGVGCVFDMLAGAVNRAPMWMQGAGLEWAFRMSQEPSRLWKRYLVNDSRMLAQLMFEWLRATRAQRGATLVVPT